MNHTAALERSLGAIFKQKHLSSHLSHERIAARRWRSGRGGREIAVMAVIYHPSPLPPPTPFHLLPVDSSAGDSGLDQFPGDHAHHISELQGRETVRGGGPHFLCSTHCKCLVAVPRSYPSVPRSRAFFSIPSSHQLEWDSLFVFSSGFILVCCFRCYMTVLVSK